jgi:ArsR family transcriptional regulator, arsenate/arsenite/antimonite-responsive transcriptional repressor
MRVDGYIQHLARMHKALGDETRLRIVHLLAQGGELCVCDIESILDVSQSKVSRHLSYLKQAGIVQDRRHGTWAYYRIAAEISPVLRVVLRELRKALAGDPDARRDLERAGTYQRTAGCAPLSMTRSARS